GGPYHAAINVPVNFTGFGSDVSPVDAQSLTYSWDLDNNSIYETQGQTASKTYTQEGIYIIGLKVMDNKDFQTDTARVIISNDPPVLSQIAGQNVMEGNTFSPVVLDNFVNDPDQDDADLMWSVSGQNQLLVSIADRILTVTIPDINWYGTETLTLRVQDAGGLTDSTHVTYAVTSVNDPPVWISPVPDFIIDEDSTVYISMDELWARAADVDHTDDQLIFTMHTESPVTWMIEPAQHRFWFKGEKDWNGTATFVYTVTDPAGMADRDTASLTIRPVPDNPAPFRIIEPILLDSTNASWPDSIMFRWHPSYDPDNPAGLIYYILSLKHIRALDSRNLTVFDTTLTFMTDKTMPDGQYLWYVTAYVPSGMSVQSNTGFIIVGEIEYQDVEAGRPVPEAYALNQNYPNPFNPETRITYHIPDRTRVDLSVFNALGQRIITLVSDDQSPGIYEIAWNGTDQFGLKVPTGIYICRMTAGSTVLYKKMMLIQ
ncbi:cadherin-like domain-containing protein, partial [bacterium]|nr:cadherin-like domain-containing protein [bacterium]